MDYSKKDLIKLYNMGRSLPNNPADMAEYEEFAINMFGKWPGTGLPPHIYDFMKRADSASEFVSLVRKFESPNESRINKINKKSTMRKQSIYETMFPKIASREMTQNKVFEYAGIYRTNSTKGEPVMNQPLMDEFVKLGYIDSHDLPWTSAIERPVNVDRVDFEYMGYNFYEESLSGSFDTYLFSDAPESIIGPVGKLPKLRGSWIVSLAPKIGMGGNELYFTGTGLSENERDAEVYRSTHDAIEGGSADYVSWYSDYKNQVENYVVDEFPEMSEEDAREYAFEIMNEYAFLIWDKKSNKSYLFGGEAWI